MRFHMLKLLLVGTIMTMATQSNAFVPYPTRSVWDTVLPTEDPFKILEQLPAFIDNNPKGSTTNNGVQTMALARADWKETPHAHLISLDIPGMKRHNIKIEVEENRLLRISGERKSEEEVEGEKWHWAERTNGKFWRQFRLPNNADLDNIKAHMEDGVLRIRVPKFAEQERKKHTKVIHIQGSDAPQDIKPTEAAA